MSLKEILGEDYKENMTDDEINAAMEKKWLASGKYEYKEKVDAERKKSAAKTKELEEKIKAKMSDDELSAKEVADLKAKIEELENEKAENNRKYSRTVAERNLSEAKGLLEIKDNDKEFDEFLASISGEDSEISSKTSTYITKLIKDAYEKGKAKATKESLGDMGAQVVDANGKSQDTSTQLVKGLINTIPKPVDSKNSNFI